MHFLSRILLVGLVLCYNQSLAQLPVEKLVCVTDRDYYSNGETVYFKAFILSQQEQIESTNLFAELLDTSMNRLAGVCLPIIEATASGSLTIPREADKGPIFLRAYTDISLLQNEPFQYIKPLFNYINKVNHSVGTPAAEPVFYPEGGKLVYQAENYVAFRAPQNFDGEVKNSKGLLIATLKPLANGLGYFTLRPEEGESYFCHWTNNGLKKSIPLPAPVKNSIALHAYQEDELLHFDLDNGGNTNASVLKPKVQLLIHGEVVFQAVINMTNFDRFSHSIPLQEFKPGMAVVRVLDVSDNILAERNVFIIKKINEKNIRIDAVKRDTAKRGENIFTINFPDTLLRNVSVSITGAAYHHQPSGHTLASALLPEGFPPVPMNTSRGGEPDLFDLEIITAGTFSETAKTKDAVNIQAPPRHLQLSGIVRKGKKILAGKEILLGIRSEYIGKELYKVVTDEQGRFVLDGMIIYGDTYVHCRMPKTNEELETEFMLKVPGHNNDNGLLQKFREKAERFLPVNKNEAAAGRNEQINFPNADTVIFSGKIIELEEAIVKSDPKLVVRKRLEELEKKYVDGTVFSGYIATGETIDVINDPQSVRALDLFTYIGSKMRSVSLQFVRGRKQLFYFGRGTGGQTMVTVFYLNNTRIDRDLLDGIRLDEVAVIKFVPMLGSEQGMPPALAIFLKKPGDQGYWEKDKYQLSEQKIYGYPVTKEFMAPDYTNTETTVQADQRKTLLWQPYTIVDKGKAEIKFYNNDMPGKLMIRINGITENGNIIYYEKLLE